MFVFNKTDGKSLLSELYDLVIGFIKKQHFYRQNFSIVSSNDTTVICDTDTFLYRPHYKCRNRRVVVRKLINEETKSNQPPHHSLIADVRLLNISNLFYHFV